MLKLCNHGETLGETERHITILYSGKFAVHFLSESQLRVLLQPVGSRCVTFVLEIQYQIDTVTTPLALRGRIQTAARN